MLIFSLNNLICIHILFHLLFGFYFIYLVLSCLRHFNSWYFDWSILISIFFILRSFHCTILTSHWINLLVCLALSYVMNSIWFFSFMGYLIMLVYILNRWILLLIAERSLLILKFLLINISVWNKLFILYLLFIHIKLKVLML